MKVQRYDYRDGMEFSEDGDFVIYSDYARLEAERDALKAEVAERNDAMAEALEILDGYGRTNPTLPMACAELMRHHTELRIEHGKLKSEVERLRAAIKLAECQYMGCGGLLTNAEAMNATLKVLRAALRGEEASNG